MQGIFEVSRLSSIFWPQHWCLFIGQKFYIAKLSDWSAWTKAVRNSCKKATQALFVNAYESNLRPQGYDEKRHF